MPRLTILQLNDLHGYVEPHSELRRGENGDFEFGRMGGLARIKTIFDQVRCDNPGGVVRWTMVTHSTARISPSRIRPARWSR